MSSSRLKSELARVEANRWHQSPYDDGVVAWLPLLSISATGLWLGLDAEGDWILGRLSGRVASSKASLPQSWLTILDSEEDAFRAKVDSAAAEHGLTPSDLQQMLPVDKVLVMAMRSGSGHWAKRAVSWLLERPLNDEHLALLSMLTTARWVDQWTRHAARRLSHGH